MTRWSCEKKDNNDYWKKKSEPLLREEGWCAGFEEAVNGDVLQPKDRSTALAEEYGTRVVAERVAC